jgi:hypothetical protein
MPPLVASLLVELLSLGYAVSPVPAASEYSALRAGIFKASGSTDPMWSFEERRWMLRRPRTSSR